MTDEEILALDGPAPNIAVAVHIMGWKREGKNWSVRPAHKTRTVIEDGERRKEDYLDWESKGEHDVLIDPEGREMYLCGCRPPDIGLSLPNFAGDIKAAKAVSEAMMRTDPGAGTHWDVHIACYGAYSVEPVYQVDMYQWGAGRRNVTARAETEERARALAALMAYWSMKDK
jgi:hypothetical protein